MRILLGFAAVAAALSFSAAPAAAQWQMQQWTAPMMERSPTYICLARSNRHRFQGGPSERVHTARLQAMHNCMKALDGSCSFMGCRRVS